MTARNLGSKSLADVIWYNAEREGFSSFQMTAANDFEPRLRAVIG